MNDKQVELARKAEKRDRWCLERIIINCFRNWDNLKADFEEIIRARTDDQSADMIVTIADSDTPDREVWELIERYVKTYRIR